MLKIKSLLSLLIVGIWLHSCTTHKLSMEPSTSKEGEPLQKKCKTVTNIVNKNKLSTIPNAVLRESFMFLPKKEMDTTAMVSRSFNKLTEANIAQWYTPEHPYEITIGNFKDLNKRQREYFRTHQKTEILKFLQDAQANGHPIRHIAYQGPGDKEFFIELSKLEIASIDMEIEPTDYSAWDIGSTLSHFSSPTVLETNITRLDCLDSSSTEILKAIACSPQLEILQLAFEPDTDAEVIRRLCQDEELMDITTLDSGNMSQLDDGEMAEFLDHCPLLWDLMLNVFPGPKLREALGRCKELLILRFDSDMEFGQAANAMGVNSMEDMKTWAVAFKAKFPKELTILNGFHRLA